MLVERILSELEQLVIELELRTGAQIVVVNQRKQFVLKNEFTMQKIEAFSISLIWYF